MSRSPLPVVASLVIFFSSMLALRLQHSTITKHILLAFTTESTESSRNGGHNRSNTTKMIIIPRDISRTTKVCRNESANLEWQVLCGQQSNTSLSVIDAFDTTLADPSKKAHVIQIGAHVGFEKNDPLAEGLSSYLRLLSAAERNRFHWTFVEPSPPNFRRLETNLKERNWCPYELFNVAVVPDGSNDTERLTFFSVRDTIDPETGFDSISKKTLPVWITQVSGLNRGPFDFNRGQFTRRGLNPDDYLVTTDVEVRQLSKLMTEVMGGDDTQRPDLMLIDTEGFDCPILLTLRSMLPRFIVFESHQCLKLLRPTILHLESLGYQVTKLKGQNSVAVLMK